MADRQENWQMPVRKKVEGPLAKGEIMLNLSNDETSSQSHTRNDHPAHSNAGINPRRTTMLNRSSILMLIATSMLATTALLPASASARGFGGGGGFHAPASPSIAATNFNR